jgi:hypothetical protein
VTACETALELEAAFGQPGEERLVLPRGAGEEVARVAAAGEVGEIEQDVRPVHRRR